ncbi:SET domain-containing protein [Dentipellis sp. KUC8613]|nr:SET domain-containing protein [Dentipellis sp. KUC8613]
MPDGGQAPVEPEKVKTFRTWLASHGASFNPKVGYAELLSGFSIVAADALEADSTIVTCPFSLAITPELSKRALLTVLKDDAILGGWSERQLICAYIVFHWIIDTQSHPAFMHTPYLDTLPSPDQLRTPLHFTPAELETLKGTNLYGATLERRANWEAEWKQCQEGIANADHEWAQNFTWDHYLTASTYLSSRAFPSTLLARTPSLVQTPASHPILLPAIDSLNHARAQPVSWVVTYPEPTTPASPASPAEPTISLIHHAPHAPLQEIFNNYGPKPNAELILGYGFAVPDNPDDTIVLKVSGSGAGARWEVGRGARGAEGLWAEVLAFVRPHAQADGAWAVVLDAAGCLESMVLAKLEALPEVGKGEVRPEVGMMVEHYVAGQRAVLGGLIRMAREKEEEAREMARREGVRLVLEDDVEEEEEEEEE